MPLAPKMRSPRVLLRHAVYVGPDDGRAPLQRLVGEDISRGGMFVLNDDELPDGTIVTIDLEVHGLPMPFARGRVVRQRGLVIRREARWRLPGFAIQFFSLSPRARALLDYLLLHGSAVSDAASAPAVE